MGSPDGDYLRPGLARQDVERALQSIGMPAPADVVDLYGWADGTDEEAWQRNATAGERLPFLRFLGDTYFPPLSDALTWYGNVQEVAAEVAFASVDALVATDLWQPSWFPVFRPDRGEYAVVCAPDQPATVRRVDWETAPNGRELASLTALIRSATAELRDEFVWLVNEQLLIRRDVARHSSSDS